MPLTRQRGSILYTVQVLVIKLTLRGLIQSSMNCSANPSPFPFTRPQPWRAINTSFNTQSIQNTLMSIAVRLSSEEVSPAPSMETEKVSGPKRPTDRYTPKSVLFLFATSKTQVNMLLMSGWVGWKKKASRDQIEHQVRWQTGQRMPSSPCQLQHQVGRIRRL